jgi:hypothetical protein
MSRSYIPGFRQLRCGNPFPGDQLIWTRSMIARLGVDAETEARVEQPRRDLGSAVDSFGIRLPRYHLSKMKVLHVE